MLESGYSFNTDAIESSVLVNFEEIVLLFVANVTFSGAVNFISPSAVLVTSTPVPFRSSLNLASCLSNILPITAPTAAPAAVPITVP